MSSKNHHFNFKEENTLEKRLNESKNIKEKYSERIPVIVELDKSFKELLESEGKCLDKNKYLVPKDLTCGQFLFVIRKRIKLSPEKALFMFVNDMLPPTHSLMSEVYEENKDDDGFLYFIVSTENTFGSF